MSKIILVGASGKIGKAVLECAIKKNLEILPTYNKKKIDGGIKFTLGIDDPQNLNINNGDKIIILAAYTDQGWISENPSVSYKINVDATKSLIDYAAKKGCYIIFLSSEAVFGFDSASGWGEESSICPVTEYGRQKAEVESFIAKYKNSCVIRTGWNVSSNEHKKCVVADVYKSLLSGHAKIASDNIFTLTDVLDTANTIVSIACKKYCGILHVVSNKPISRKQLAEIIIKNSIFSKEMNFTEILYSQLRLKEKKSGCSWIRSAKKLSSLIGKFKDPSKIVEEKVIVLDSLQLVTF